MPWASKQHFLAMSISRNLIFLLAAASNVAAGLPGACNEVLGGKCIAGLAASMDEANSMAADFMQKSMFLESEETDKDQRGLLKDWLAAEAEYLAFQKEPASIMHDHEQATVSQFAGKVQQRNIGEVGLHAVHTEIQPATTLGLAAHEEKNVEKVPEMQHKEVLQSVMAARNADQHNEKNTDTKKLAAGFAGNNQVQPKSSAADEVEDPLIQDLKVTREQLSKHFGENDPIIAALDNKIQFIAAGASAKDPLIHELWSTREKLREHFGADDPIIAVLDSKIQLARTDVNTLAQQGANSKDSKQAGKIDGHQGLEHKQKGKSGHEKQKGGQAEDGQEKDAHLGEHEEAPDDMPENEEENEENEENNEEENAEENEKEEKLEEKQMDKKKDEQKDKKQGMRQDKHTDKHDKQQTKQDDERWHSLQEDKLNEEKDVPATMSKHMAAKGKHTDMQSAKVVHKSKHAGKGKIANFDGQLPEAMKRQAGKNEEKPDDDIEVDKFAQDGSEAESTAVTESKQSQKEAGEGAKKEEKEEKERAEVLAHLKEASEGARKEEKEEKERAEAKAILKNGGFDPGLAKFFLPVKSMQSVKQKIGLDVPDQKVHEAHEDQKVHETHGHKHKKHHSKNKAQDQKVHKAHGHKHKRHGPKTKMQDQEVHKADGHKHKRHHPKKKTQEDLISEQAAEEIEGSEEKEIEGSKVNKKAGFKSVEEDEDNRPLDTEAQQMLSVLQDAFTSLDRDHNNHLDEEEMQVLGLMGESDMAAYDKDHSGGISLEEYVQQSLTEQGY